MLHKEPPTVFIPRLMFALVVLVLSATPNIIDQQALLIIITSIFFLFSLTYCKNITNHSAVMILTLLRIISEVFYMVGLFIVTVNILLLDNASIYQYVLGYTLLGTYLGGLIFIVWRNYRSMKKVY